MSYWNILNHKIPCSQSCHPTLIYEAGIDIVGTYWHCVIFSLAAGIHQENLFSLRYFTWHLRFSELIIKWSKLFTLIEFSGGGGVFPWQEKCGKKEILMYSPIPTSVINIRSLDGASLSLQGKLARKLPFPLLPLFAFRNPTLNCDTLNWDKSNNKLASSVDAIAISEIWNYDPLTDWQG